MLPIPEKIPGFHSERSPSTAHRWRLCPGSVNQERGLPDDVGEEALQGTVFHDYAADCLELGMEPWYLVGDRFLSEDGKYREFTQEMASKMIPGLDLVWALADVPGAILLVEKRVNLENWIGPDESGTADALVIDALNWRLTGFDWKWGAGVPVHPELNDQAMLYLLGAWDTYAHDLFKDAWALGETPYDSWEEAKRAIQVKIIIEQPRAPGGGGVWDTTMGDLLKEGRRIRRDADATLDPDAPLVPGEKQCKFCKAAAQNTCPARAAFVAELTGLMLDELEDDFVIGAEPELLDRRSLTPEQRSQIVLHKKFIEGWLQQLHDEVVQDHERGYPTPGLKRVPGRSGARKWIDDNKAEIMLEHDFRENAWTKKLRSPANVEDEVGKKAYRDRYERLAVMGDSKPILVPDTDPRPEIVSDAVLLDEDEPEELL